MNIAWLDINSSWSHSSLAIPALEVQLKNQTRERCNFSIISGTIKSNQHEIIEEIIVSKPNYIFATAWLFNTNYIQEILTKVTEIIDIEGVFLGGPEFLGDNEEFLKSNKYVSAIFKGEGEEMFDSFIQSLLNKDKKWQEIEGFEFLYNNEYQQSKIVYIKDFSKLNFPENSQFFNWNKSFVQLETSRGCFNSCRFCISGIENSKIQNIPIEILRERINKILSHNIHQIRILDRTFNGNTLRAEQLINLFKEYAGKINFHIEIHPALLKSPFKEILSTLPDKLLHVEAGMQTLQQNVLDKCKRIGTCSDAINGLSYLINTKRFDVHADLISGLPNYSYKQLIDDVITLMEINPAEIQLESLKLLPGTYFRNNSKSLEIKYSKIPPYEVLESDCMSYRDINKSMIISKILDFWYNDKRWQGVFREIFRNDAAGLDAFAEYLKGTDYVMQPLSLESKGVLLYRYCKEKKSKFLNNIALEWVKNGLSIKKEPAEKLVMWDYNSNVKNPLFNLENNRDKYYYLKINNIEHWFAFNKEINRTAPYKYLQVS